MKRSWIAATVLCLAAVVADAAPVQTWDANRDSCIRAKNTIGATKRGTYSSNRLVTTSWDGNWFGDWSWTDKQEIAAKLLEDPGAGLTWELRLEVMSSSATAYDTAVWAVAAFKSKIDWLELGSSSIYGACNQSPDWEGGATPGDVGYPLWTKMDDTTVTGFYATDTSVALENVVNTDNFVGLPADGAWASVVLDATVVQWILSDPAVDGVRGLVMVKTGAESLTGQTIYTDEGTSGKRPRLALYAVPEPASLALLGVGGLALLRRRRR